MIVSTWVRLWKGDHYDCSTWVKLWRGITRLFLHAWVRLRRGDHYDCFYMGKTVEGGSL